MASLIIYDYLSFSLIPFALIILHLPAPSGKTTSWHSPSREHACAILFPLHFPFPSLLPLPGTLPLASSLPNSMGLCFTSITCFLSPFFLGLTSSTSIIYPINGLLTVKIKRLPVTHHEDDWVLWDQDCLQLLQMGMKWVWVLYCAQGPSPQTHNDLHALPAPGHVSGSCMLGEW